MICSRAHTCNFLEEVIKVGELLIPIIVVAGIILIIIISIISISNGIVRAIVKIDEASSGIDVALTKRYDTLTKMIDVVRAYASHEQETLFKTIELRKGMTIEEKNSANKEMDEQFSQINILAESYPELKSSENYNTLQKAIADVEEHLQAARRLYNSNVSNYNQMIQVFPNSIIAKSKGCTKKEFFVAEEAKTEDIKVDL